MDQPALGGAFCWAVLVAFALDNLRSIRYYSPNAAKNAYRKAEQVGLRSWRFRRGCGVEGHALPKLRYVDIGNVRSRKPVSSPATLP